MATRGAERLGWAGQTIGGSMVVAALLGGFFESSALAGGPAGMANGAGPCTTQNEASTCASGSCSPNAGVCIPSTITYGDAGQTTHTVPACSIAPDAGAPAPSADGGSSGLSTGGGSSDAGASPRCTTGDVGTCAVDADCSGGRYCDTASFLCHTPVATGNSLPDGAHCSADGVSSMCASGACNPATNTCAARNGSSCTSVSMCASNVCDNSICGFADGRGPCAPNTASKTCLSGYCGSSGTCEQPGQCASDTDCFGAEYCDPSAKQCTAARSNGQSVPVFAGSCSSHVAADGGAPLNVCASHQCNAATNTCSGPNGSVCSEDADCSTGSCGTNGLCGLANGSGSCSAKTAAKCQSGVCGASGTCVPAAAGTCSTDSECSSGHYCNQQTFSCTAAGGTGDALPTDGSHSICSANGTSAACASGTCNRSTNTCIAENSGACTSNVDCASGVCDADGKCGLVDGETNCGGTDQCRTGICDDTSTCVPCVQDYQCSTGNFCSDNHECHKLLADSVSCTSSHECANAACSFGVCGGTAPVASSLGSSMSSSADAGVTPESVSTTTPPIGNEETSGSAGGCSVSSTNSASGGASSSFLLALFGLGWVAARRRRSSEKKVSH